MPGTKGAGLGELKRAVRVLGARAIDRRTTVGKALTDWRDQLIVDLGGSDGISTQQRALVDLVVRTKLMLDSVDAWVLKQRSLVNARGRSLLPVVRERTQLAVRLAKQFADAEITSQQLVDGSVVLLNDNRIQLPLTAGKVE